jgi:hypothetical protein
LTRPEMEIAVSFMGGSVRLFYKLVKSENLIERG